MTTSNHEAMNPPRDQQLCLVVALHEHEQFRSAWDTFSRDHQLAMKTKFVDMAAAMDDLQAGNACALVIATNDSSVDVTNLLRLFSREVGPISACQMIVCNEPQPVLLADCFEFGVDQLVSSLEWPQVLANFCRTVAEKLSDESSLESCIIRFSQAAKSQDAAGLSEFIPVFKELSQENYLGAFVYGQVLKSIGRFREAMEAYILSLRMNQYFVPTLMQLSECLLLGEKLHEAMQILESLDRINPRDMDRKIDLGLVYYELDRPADAEAMRLAVSQVEPRHPRLAEMQILEYLKGGKVDLAYQLMDQLSDVGPFVMAKVNETGIKLSKSGKGKSALALYQKAHAIVRPELRYKISLNAALAAHRLGEHQSAMDFLMRCEQEYGGSFDKLEKIKAAVIAAQK